MGFLQTLKGMKCILKARKMTKEQKLDSLREKYEYINTNLLPKIPIAERPAAKMKIQAKYIKLVKKVEKEE